MAATAVHDIDILSALKESISKRNGNYLFGTISKFPVYWGAEQSENRDLEEIQLSKLSESQKTAVIAFLYYSEVMGEGHVGFWDLYGKYISHSTVMVALNEICVSDRYIKIIEELPKDFIPVSEITDKCISEESFDMEMKRIYEICNEFDNRFYQYGDEENIDKIIFYVKYPNCLQHL